MKRKHDLNKVVYRFYSVDIIHVEWEDKKIVDDASKVICTIALHALFHQEA